MAISVQNQADQVFANTATTRDLVHTVATGTDRLLLVFVQWNSDGTPRSIDSVTWDEAGANESLTELGSVANGGSGDDAHAAAWILVNPTVGASKNITVDWSGEVGGPQSIVAYTLTGVDQDHPIRDHAGEAFNDGNSFDVEAIFQTVSGDFVAGAATMEMGLASDADWTGSTPTMTEVQNEGYTAGSPDSWFGAAYGSTTATTTTVNCTFDDNDHVAGYFVVVAATGTGWACPGNIDGTCRRSATNENVSTYGAAGQGRDYTVLNTWESDTDIDMVSAQQSEIIELYDDSTSFADRLAVAGGTVNASYFRIARPATGEGHDGTPNNGVWLHVTSGTGAVLDVDEDYFQAQDIILSMDIATTSSILVVRFEDTGDYRVGAGLIIKQSANTDDTARGISLRGNQDILVNCLAQDVEGYAIDAQPTSSNKCYFLNCVAANNGGVGFRVSGAASSSSIVAKNCLSYNNTGEDFQNGDPEWDTTNSSHNASSDTTASQFTSGRASQTFTFEDAANDDFHLDVTDAGARNYGTDLSEYSIFCFDDDIDGELFTTWDIGFDEPESTTTREFASTANIVFSTSSDGNATRELASTANIVFSTSSDGDVTNQFVSQADVVFDISSDAFLENLFVSQADIVFATNTPALNAEREFASQADVVFNTASDGNAERQFTTTANVVFSTASDGNAEREFTSTGNVVFDLTSDVKKTNQFVSQSDIVFDLNSDANTEREFSSQADVVFDISSDIDFEIIFASQADVVFSTASDAQAEREFASTANVVFDITSDALVDRSFASQADIIFSISSDIQGDRIFASQADVVFSLQSDIHQTMDFASTANVVFDTSSDAEADQWRLADSYTVNTGSYNSGDVTDTWTEDSNSLLIDEVSGTPGFDLEFEFGLVPTSYDQAGAILSIYIRYIYNGFAGHNIKLQAWNYNTTSWVNITAAANDFPESGGISDVITFIFDGDSGNLQDYIDNRTVLLRFYHTSAGNPTHDFGVEYLTLDAGHFHSEPVITFDTVSDANAQREFASQGDIVFAAQSDVNQTMVFATTANVVFSTTSDAKVENHFVSQSDIVFDTQSDIQDERSFASTANIVFDTSSEIHETIQFSTQADIVFDTQSDANAERQFAVAPQAIQSFTYFDNNRWQCDFPPVNCSWSGSDWPFNATGPGSWGWSGLDELGTWVQSFRPFQMQITYTGGSPTTGSFILYDTTLGIIANTGAGYVSGANIPISFAGNDIKELKHGITSESFALVVTNITFDSLGGLGYNAAFSLESSIGQERNFASQADIVFDAVSDGNAEREFSTSPIIVFSLTSDGNAERELTTTANVVFDTSSDVGKTNDFDVTANVVFSTNTPSPNAEREFSSQADVVFDLSTQLLLIFDFDVTANIVFDTESLMRREIRPTSQAGIFFSLTSDIDSERQFASTGNVIFSTTSHGQAEREFGSQPGPAFNLTSDIHKLIDFDSQADIVFATNTPELSIGKEFASQADIVFDTVSDTGMERHFKSTPLISLIFSSDVIKQVQFVSQADVGFFINQPNTNKEINFECFDVVEFNVDGGALQQTIDFTSTANVIFDTSSDIESGNLFSSQADIVFDLTSDGNAERNFNVSTTTHIVFSTSSNIAEKANFYIVANVVFDTQSDANQEMVMASQADVEFYLPDPFLAQVADFASQADIVFDTSSSMQVIRDFASQADVVFNITDPIIRRDIRWYSPALIAFSTSSDIGMERVFSSQADVIFSLTSDISREQKFASQADIEFFVSPPEMYFLRNFISQADIIFDTQSDFSTGREFATTANVIFSLTSDGNAERELASTSNVIFSTTSDANAERELATQTDIVFSTESLMRRVIEIGSQSDVVFSTNEPGYQREIWIAPQADIVFETNDVSWNVENPFVINRFQIDEIIVTNIESDIHNNLNFGSQADIGFNINNFRILVQRNLSSTVNIIIGVNNIDSLQNLTLRDLLDPRVRLLTPNQSTTLVSVG